jgi:RHS repeat-associated protein
MPGRTYNSSDYRYGFNGKENDKEIDAGAQDFGARIYDNRLGKFFSQDPFMYVIPNKTPYCFAGNSPIAFIDINGGFQVPPSVAGAYPKLKTMAKAISNLANSDKSLNNPIIKKFIEWSGLPNDQDGVNRALQALSYGSGPIVQVAPMTGLGSTPNDCGEFIYIAKDLADDLQNGTYGGTENKLQGDYATMLTVMFTMWHEGIHSTAIETGFDNSTDVMGLDNGDKAEIEGVGFNVSGRQSFIQHWNDGLTPANTPPINSLFMGTTSWRDSYNFMNMAMMRNYTGPFVNAYGYNKVDMGRIGEVVGKGAAKIGAAIGQIFSNIFSGGNTGSYQNARFLD